jgi:hypothetical protein
MIPSIHRATQLKLPSQALEIVMVTNKKHAGALKLIRMIAGNDAGRFYLCRHEFCRRLYLKENWATSEDRYSHVKSIVIMVAQDYHSWRHRQSFRM